ncbi:hypothetical protein ACTGJ9_036460 [Bradyrhizobium sp. RDM12]
MTRMKAHFVATFVLVVAAQAWTGPGRAGDEVPAAEAPANDLALSPDSLIPREDWKRRIEDARKRAERARRDWQHNAPLRLFAPDPPEKIATQRVLGGDTLQSGDIVSTDKGFFLFRGRSGADGQTPDLVPIAPASLVARHLFYSVALEPREFCPGRYESSRRARNRECPGNFGSQSNHDARRQHCFAEWSLEKFL